MRGHKVVVAVRGSGHKGQEPDRPHGRTGDGRDEHAAASASSSPPGVLAAHPSPFCWYDLRLCRLRLLLFFALFVGQSEFCSLLAVEVFGLWKLLLTFFYHYYALSSSVPVEHMSRYLIPSFLPLEHHHNHKEKDK